MEDGSEEKVEEEKVKGWAEVEVEGKAEEEEQQQQVVEEEEKGLQSLLGSTGKQQVIQILAVRPHIDISKKSKSVYCLYPHQTSKH